jgi:hypothetical protein
LWTKRLPFTKGGQFAGFQLKNQAEKGGWSQPPGFFYARGWQQ